MIWELKNTKKFIKRKKEEIKNKNIKREQEEEKENEEEKNTSKQIKRLLIIKENRKIKDLATLKTM